VSRIDLGYAVEFLNQPSVHRSRKVIHDWMQEADIQAKPGKSPNLIALDETVIRINDLQF
jgi:putative transposase